MTSRERFEAWYFDKYMRPPERSHFRPEEYLHSRDQDRWEGWQANEPKWQDISTAPKDGTEILLWPAVRHGREAAVGAWIQIRGGDFCWYDLTVGHHNGSWLPTHWQPIPSPPSNVTGD